MRKSGPIIVIDDDLDDQDLLAEAFKAMNCLRQVIFFSDGYKALQFLENTDNPPLLILSDVNMPRINGFELREKIQNSKNLKLKTIPYLFLTTGAQREAVEAAYARSAQGFFIKPNSMSELNMLIRKVVDYWEACQSPGKYTLQSNGHHKSTAATSK